jgi:hypothetical protein
MMEGENDKVDISETTPKKKRRQYSQKYLAEYESLFPCFLKLSIRPSNAVGDCTVCGIDTSL